MVAADHLQVPRHHGLFLHHGIDLGDGTIAHYLEGREIIRSSLEVFCKGQPFSVIEHVNASSRRVTLIRAMSRIGEQNYNLLFNNCEHFANWCKTGMHSSSQMEDLLTPSSLGAIAMGKIIPKGFIQALTLLIQQGLTNEISIKKAKQGLEILEKIRRKLLHKLESTLEKANTSNNHSSKIVKETSQVSIPSSLLTKGRLLADELSALEDLKTQILDLINQSSHQK